MSGSGMIDDPAAASCESQTTYFCPACPAYTAAMMFSATLSVVGAAAIVVNPAVSASGVHHDHIRVDWTPAANGDELVGLHTRAGSRTELHQSRDFEDLREVVDCFVEHVLYEAPDRAADVTHELCRRVACVIVRKGCDCTHPASEGLSSGASTSQS
jgi:hypothetical protein